MSKYFEMLESEIPAIKILHANPDATGFFIQEVIRFYSISATLVKNEFVLDANASVDERYLTHILSRSLLEPFFVILYIFDDLSLLVTRYEEHKNTFKEDYRKLMNDLGEPEWQDFMLNYSNKLEAADPNWSKLNKLPDVKTMLNKLKNDYSDSLGYLYPLYRITSFDTHGRSLGIIFESVFGKQCNFPILKIKQAIELMSNEYIVVLNQLRANKLI